MGANELSNRVEATAWVVAAGTMDGEGAGSPVAATDFFFRSLSGFVNKLEIIGPVIGDSWDDVDFLNVVLFLERNYARDHTTIACINPITTARGQTGVAGGPAIPVTYIGPSEVFPITQAGYEIIKNNLGDFQEPAGLDPYSVIVCTFDLSGGVFQRSGKGLEFGIQVTSMAPHSGDTDVEVIVLGE